MALREPWRGAGGSSGDTEKKGGLEMEYGILGIIVLILDIYALVKTWQSAVSTGAKLLWTLLIVVLPVIGFIIWLIAGPRAQAASTPDASGPSFENSTPGRETGPVFLFRGAFCPIMTGRDVRDGNLNSTSRGMGIAKPPA